MRKRLTQGKLVTFLLFLMIAGSVSGKEEKPLFLPQVSYQGDFYAAGEVVLPPGAVPTVNNLTVLEKKSGRYLPCKVRVLEIWPDGSVQRVEVIFTVAAGQAGHYVLVYGQDVNQKSFLRETAVLPTVSFSLAGLPPPAENMDLPVGQINVRVERSPDIRYYWHLTPLAAIVFLLFLRRRRWNRMDKKQE